MPFYHFSQNNSGGVFDFTEDLTHHMVIEADSAEDANIRLIELGGYFDGCDSGKDCSCCGDRWYRVDDEDGKNTPSIYGNECLPIYKDACRIWRKDGREVFVYYKDGRKVVPPCQR